MLRLGKMTDYGVVALGFMASRRGDRLSAVEVAEGTGLPSSTVSQVLKTLVHGGILVSHRGVQGGYCMVRSADEISIAEVIRAFEGPLSLTACVDGATDACGSEGHCLLRGGWDRVNQAVRDALEGVSLHDVLGHAVGFGVPAWADETGLSGDGREGAYEQR